MIQRKWSAVNTDLTLTFDSLKRAMTMFCGICRGGGEFVGTPLEPGEREEVEPPLAFRQSFGKTFASCNILL